MRKKRVLVAMSSGVDSSLAAALLLEQGYEVIGITMDLFADPPDAAQVTKTLGIEHHLLDLRQEFQDKVITDFSAEYAQGRTPNPCIRCNEQIKFRILWERAADFDAEFMATGHHARIYFSDCFKRYFLLKGDDPAKDQSYFLYRLTQEQLARSLFPIGELTKAGVREKARQLDLPVAERPESQEICFIPDNDYAGFLEKRIPEAFLPGPIKDAAGNTLGEHTGILRYTVGQRRGLGIAAPRPLYVLEIRTTDNVVVVGEEHLLYKDRLRAVSLNWISQPKLDQTLEVKARIRYRHEESRARVIPSGEDEVTVEFQEPQRAVSPGQSVVFYTRDQVLGGGIIDRTDP